VQVIYGNEKLGLKGRSVGG